MRGVSFGHTDSVDYTDFWSQEWLLGAFIAAQEPLARRSQIYQNLLKEFGGNNANYTR